MAWIEARFYSEVLGKQTGLTVLLPDVGVGPFPVFYLLHGLSDDHTIWHRHTRIESYVRDRKIIVVMPDGSRGFYTNHADGPAHGRHILDDVMGFAERTFAISPSRKNCAIGGLSMGGYGALRLGLLRPDLFGSITAHSGPLLRGRWTADENARNKGSFGPAEYRRVFGDKPRGSEHDLWELARRLAKVKQRPRISIDCGMQDPLLSENQAFSKELSKLKIAHRYAEFEGAHNWDYWDARLNWSLDFHFGKA